MDKSKDTPTDELLTHPWEPVFDERSRVLILGTFPSPRSRAEGFYFGHPQNVFWTSLAQSLGAPSPPSPPLAPPSPPPPTPHTSIAEKTAFLLEHQVALWDVVASCRIQGASDASIADVTPHRFTPLLAGSRIEAVFTTGRTATSLFNRLAASEAGMRAVYLPSTSPANRAAQSRPEFTQLWGNVGRVLRGEVVSAAGMKAADAHTINARGIPSLTLMERAAQAVVDELLCGDAGFDTGRVLCVCGTGNNGGDGLAVARLLRQQGCAADALLAGRLHQMTAECAQQLAWAREAGVAVLVLEEGEGGAKTDGAGVGATELPGAKPAGTDYRKALAQATTVVDGLFGIGIFRERSGLSYHLIRAINNARMRGTKVLAIDIPSGISADSGEVLGAAVQADTTVTFAHPKLGLTIEPGRHHAGALRVADIGIRW